jgi:hypothetical protein
VWLNSPPPGYRAVTVPTPPPGVGGSSGGSGDVVGGPQVGEIPAAAVVGKDLSGRELDVLASAATLQRPQALVP